MSRKSTAMFGLLSLSRFVAGRIHVFPSLTWHYSLQIFVDSQISLVVCFPRFCICLGAPRTFYLPPFSRQREIYVAFVS